MTKIHSVHRAAQVGTMTAVLVAFSVGPVMAGHGYGMKNNPLRGDFPTSTTEAHVAPAAAEARPVARQRSEPGGWLRGDFPLAAESQPEQASPEPATAEARTVVTRGLSETWSCTVQAASAPAAGDPTQAVMRVIRLPQ